MPTKHILLFAFDQILKATPQMYQQVLNIFFRFKIYHFLNAHVARDDKLHSLHAEVLGTRRAQSQISHYQVSTISHFKRANLPDYICEACFQDSNISFFMIFLCPSWLSIIVSITSGKLQLLCHPWLYTCPQGVGQFVNMNVNHQSVSIYG